MIIVTININLTKGTSVIRCQQLTQQYTLLQA